MEKKQKSHFQSGGCMGKCTSNISFLTFSLNAINEIFIYIFTLQIRIWLHIPAVMQHIIPFRTYVIRYLCKLSDQELRQTAARNMADLMWSTVKEPLDTALCFDKESLDLAFKYFMSPTLTMRLAGLSQITNQLHTFNDVCNNESLVSDTET